MSAVKNIIFDYGGVILNIDYQKTVDAFRNLGLNDFDRLYSQALQVDLFDRLEKGLLTPADFYHSIRDISGLNLPDSRIEEAWNSIILDMPPHRISLLEKVRRHYRIFLLSNTNEIHCRVYTAQLKEKYGYGDFSELFEKVYFSFRIGMKKPDPVIFQLVLTENNLNPVETLFIDDSVQHIKAAELSGLKTCFLEDYKEVSDLFTKDGLLFPSTYI